MGEIHGALAQDCVGSRPAAPVLALRSVPHGHAVSHIMHLYHYFVEQSLHPTPLKGQAPGTAPCKPIRIEVGSLATENRVTLFITGIDDPALWRTLHEEHLEKLAPTA